MSLRVISAPYFLATKLEAFAMRGAGDFQASIDIEDVVSVIDGRPSIVTEIAAAPDDVRGFLSRRLDALMSEGTFELGSMRLGEALLGQRSLFLEALPGHLRGDRDRERLVLERLRQIRDQR